MEGDGQPWGTRRDRERNGRAVARGKSFGRASAQAEAMYKLWQLLVPVTSSNVTRIIPSSRRPLLLEVVLAGTSRFLKSIFRRIDEPEIQSWYARQVAEDVHYYFPRFP